MFLGHYLFLPNMFFLYFDEHYDYEQAWYEVKLLIFGEVIF